MIKFIKIYNNKLSLIIVLITESEFLQFNEKVLYNEITYLFSYFFMAYDNFYPVSVIWQTIDKQECLQILIY